MWLKKAVDTFRY